MLAFYCRRECHGRGVAARDRNVTGEAERAAMDREFADAECRACVGAGARVIRHLCLEAPRRSCSCVSRARRADRPLPRQQKAERATENCRFHIPRTGTALTIELFSLKRI